MSITPWNSPFEGLLFFLCRPRLWGWALLGTISTAFLTFYACYKTIAATLPSSRESWAPYLWHLSQSLGWGLFVFILMLAIVFPLIFNACFTKGLARYIEKGKEGSVMKAVISSFLIFFRTLRWRILWPLLLLVCILVLPILIFPLSLLAANHLAVLEGVDLVLSLYGWGAARKIAWLRSHGTECFAAAVSGSLLSFLLGLTLVGWLVWIPAMYCGVFLWIQREENAQQPNENVL